MAPKMAQKYQVIARKYRPQKFSDVVGQEAILRTLKNALARDAIAHAYLFCGARGVGKTTLARLFAKALNCAALTSDKEPCNECPSCLEIARGQSLDVIEIDGASNRGIDDIREINETVAFAPSHGKYKIYLIDEVHMLTKEAFNALLKTLEEPPPQVKFFFATTEPHKVLPTIISRCQRFDLGRLTPSMIRVKLASIAKDLGRTVEPAALHLLSEFADGSLRDAESLLDQLLCFAIDALTEADVRQTLGLAPKELFFAFDEAFFEEKLGFAFELTAKLFDSGKDLGHFLDQLIEHFRHLALCKTLGAHMLELPPELIELYNQSAPRYTQSQILFILDHLIRSEAQLAKSPSMRTALELTLLGALRAKNRLPIETLVRKLSELEEKLAAQANALHEEKPPAPQVLAPKPSSDEILIAPLQKMQAAQPSAPHEEKPPAPQVLAPKPSSDETLIAPPQKIQAAQANALHEEKPPAPQVLAPKPSSDEILIAPLQKMQATQDTSLDKHPSHYETIMRFAAVELEGTIQK